MSAATALAASILNLNHFAVKVRGMNSCRIITLLVATLAGCSQAPKSPPASLPRQALHVCNWHYIPKDHFAADLKTASGNQLTQEDLEAQYNEFLDEVEAFQREQIKELRELIKEHGLKHIWLEGLTDSRMPEYEELIKQTRAIEAESLPKALEELSKVRGLIAAFEADGQNSPELTDARAIESKLTTLMHEQRERRLRLGAPGLLYMSGEIAEIKPLEDDAAFAKANPVTSDGTVVFDEAASDERDEAIAQRIIDAQEPISLIVLGGGHKLDRNLWQLSDGKVYCQRIELPEFKRLMEKHGQ